MEINENTLATTPQEVFNILKAVGMQEEEQEHLIALIVDVRNKVKGFYTVTIGLLDYSFAHAREVFRYAILQGAAKIILAHNHPSGNANPSANDIRLTSKMKQAGEIIGIELLDHIIIGENTYFSFLEENILN